jgi:hypothetical protein
MCDECKEINDDVLELIEFCIKDNPSIEFKVCKQCGRNLPAHELFYNIRVDRGVQRFRNQCKECYNHNNTFEFSRILEGLKADFYKKISYLMEIKTKEEICEMCNMTLEQLNNIMENVKLKKYYITNSDISDEKIKEIYRKVLNNGEEFPNGFFATERNVRVVLKYLIEEVLNWKKQDFCNKFQRNTLGEYKLSTLTSIKIDILKLINEAFPEWNIKKWELKKSTVGSGFWNNKNNILEVEVWLKEELLKKNLNTIYDAKIYGFEKIIREYGFSAIFNKHVKNHTIFFEEVYNEEFVYENYLQLIAFEDFPKIPLPSSREQEGKLYCISEAYNNLDEVGKSLINQVINFIENNKRFPNSYEMTNKDGYVSISYYYKYFNNENFIENIKNYIINLSNIKPITIKCRKCGIKKDYNENNFSKKATGKFDLSNICRECLNKDTTRRLYKKRGVIFNEITDITPEQWYEYRLNNERLIIPDFCYEEGNLIKVFRYFFLEKLRYTEKEQICSNFSTTLFREHKLMSYYERIENKVDFIKKCFNEYDIIENDLKIIVDNEGNIFDSYDEKRIYEYIKNNNIFNYIKHVGNKRSGKYVFKTNNVLYKKVIPDFAIEFITIKEEKIKLNKPIILEYYGFWSNKREERCVTDRIINNYVDKTEFKEQFYKLNNDIYYIGIFPNDIKNNYEGLNQKIKSFVEQNFNISIL